MTIKKDILTINFTPDGMKEVRGICMHSMWGTYQGSIAWFKNPTSKASAHYLISAEGEITQMVLDKDMAWHAGIIDDIGDQFPWVMPNPNWYCIGIELEDKQDPNWQYPVAQREAASWLVAKIRKAYNIPLEKIVMHRQLNPSRRSDPVGNYALEWLANAVTPDGGDDVKRALELLEAFRVEQGHGNLEGAMRDLLGSYGDNQDCQVQLKRATKDCDERVKIAIASAETGRDEYWQNKCETAKLNWKELLIMAIKKFPN